MHLYRVVYKTEFNGRIVNASGLVAVPVTANAITVASYHHGTITTQAGAPSAFTTLDVNNIDPNVALGAGMASMGMIVVLPDYLVRPPKKERRRTK